MSQDNQGRRQLTRRELVRLAGVSGLAVAGASVATAISPRWLTSVAAAPEDSPEGFLASGFAQRARSMSSGDVGPLDGLYDSASNVLKSFEKDRAQFFRSGLGARWRNSTMLGYSTSVQLLGLTVSGSTANVRLRELVQFDWIPNVPALPAAAQQARQRDPQGYEPVLPRGARGEITSGFATRHELTLIKGAGGWRIAADAYDEFDLFGESPDLTAGSWADVQMGSGPTGTNAPAQPETAPRLLAINYNRSLAVQSAYNNHQYYNPDFCDFNGCGGDCANFASQCLTAGGQTRDGIWDVYSGECSNGGCNTPTATYAGNDTWGNNQLLRDWVNRDSNPSNPRGYPVSYDWQLKNGDLINYRWPGGCTDGYATQHVALVVDAGGPYVACHTPDRYAWYYQDIWSGCGSAQYWTYTQLKDTWTG